MLIYSVTSDVNSFQQMCTTNINADYYQKKTDSMTYYD